MHYKFSIAVFFPWQFLQRATKLSTWFDPPYSNLTWWSTSNQACSCCLQWAHFHPCCAATNFFFSYILFYIYKLWCWIFCNQRSWNSTIMFIIFFKLWKFLIFIWNMFIKFWSRCIPVSIWKNWSPVFR